METLDGVYGNIIQAVASVTDHRRTAADVRSAVRARVGDLRNAEVVA
jgi:hypothetical protein